MAARLAQSCCEYPFDFGDIFSSTDIYKVNIQNIYQTWNLVADGLLDICRNKLTLKFLLKVASQSIVTMSMTMLRCLPKLPQISSVLARRLVLGSVRSCSGGTNSGVDKKLPRPESLGARAKKDDGTKNKGPVSWVNLGVTGVIVLSMVIARLI
jgi:hypothetical protein